MRRLDSCSASAEFWGRTTGLQARLDAQTTGMETRPTVFEPKNLVMTKHSLRFFLKDRDDVNAAFQPRFGFAGTRYDNPISQRKCWTSAFALCNAGFSSH